MGSIRVMSRARLTLITYLYVGIQLERAERKEKISPVSLVSWIRYAAAERGRARSTGEDKEALSMAHALHGLFHHARVTGE